MQSRVDDSSIGDDELLWRDIPPIQGWFHRNPDGSIRPSSMAFLDGITGEVSVRRAALTDKETVLKGNPELSIAEVKVRFPRSLGCAVVADPEPQDPSHALICPPPTVGMKRRKKDARKIAEQSHFLVMHAPHSILPPMQPVSDLPEE